MKRILCVLLFVFGLLTSAWADSSRYASESVLNSGKWVKIQVAEDGIYKLTAADLKKMGFSNLDKVAIYGYGGWPLDEDFSTTYIDDVPETRPAEELYAHHYGNKHRAEDQRPAPAEVVGRI